MKQFSFAVNILLLVAVGVLYYLHFSQDKKPAAKHSGTVASSQAKDSCAKGHMIAFIEIDSIYDNVTHIRDVQKALTEEQNNINNQYQAAGLKFEKEKNDFLQKAPGMTPQQREEAQNKLIQAQQDIENTRQTQAQNAAANRNRKMEDIQTSLKKYLDEYNSDKRYAYIFATGGGLDYMMYRDSAHNITQDIIAGLNKLFEKKDK